MEEMDTLSLQCESCLREISADNLKVLEGGIMCSDAAGCVLASHERDTIAQLDATIDLVRGLFGEGTV